MRTALGVSRAVACALTVMSASLVSAQDVDRSRPPVPGPSPAARFPDVQYRKLSNGITVAVVEDHEIPTVRVRTVFSISPLQDPDGKSGLSELTTAMLLEGSSGMSADQLAEASANIGTPVTPTTFFTITPNVDRALAIMGELLLHPTFPEASLERLKGERLATLRRSKGDPAAVANRLFAKLAYGAGHPYGRTSSEQSIGSITRADVEAFYADYFRPQNVAFVVGGDITPTEAVAKLEKVFGAWQAGGKPGMPDVPAPHSDSLRIYLFDLPAASQTVIMAGQAGPPRDTPDYFALRLMNDALGGGLSSRLFRSIREKRGLTYGISSSFQYRHPPQAGLFAVSSRVQTSKTDTALVEILRELREINGDRPLTDDELLFARNSAVRSLPLQFETITQKVNAVVVMLNEGLPADYYTNLASNLSGVTIEQARAATSRHLSANRMTVLLVGDRKTIEQPIRRLGIAPVVVIDENGNPIP